MAQERRGRIEVFVGPKAFKVAQRRSLRRNPVDSYMQEIDEDIARRVAKRLYGTSEDMDVIFRRGDRYLIADKKFYLEVLDKNGRPIYPKNNPNDRD